MLWNVSKKARKPQYKQIFDKTVSDFEHTMMLFIKFQTKITFTQLNIP